MFPLNGPRDRSQMGGCGPRRCWAWSVQHLFSEGQLHGSCMEMPYMGSGPF